MLGIASNFYIRRRKTIVAFVSTFVYIVIIFIVNQRMKFCPFVFTKRNCRFFTPKNSATLRIKLCGVLVFVVVSSKGLKSDGSSKNLAEKMSRNSWFENGEQRKESKRERERERW